MKKLGNKENMENLTSVKCMIFRAVRCVAGLCLIFGKVEGTLQVYVVVN